VLSFVVLDLLFFKLKTLKKICFYIFRLYYDKYKIRVRLKLEIYLDTNIHEINQYNKDFYAKMIFNLHIRTNQSTRHGDGDLPLQVLL